MDEDGNIGNITLLKYLAKTLAKILQELQNLSKTLAKILQELQNLARS
jgi:prefoldin subunit 5